MICPSCSNTLQSIAVTTRQGGRFDVDHCGRCGGTWFDPYEINRIPYHEVVTLADLTVANLRKIQQNSTLLCPIDHKALEPFSGDAVPVNVRLLWCKKCLGIWASQKDLWEFKKHQDEVISAYDTAEKFFPSLSVLFVPALTLTVLVLMTFATIRSLEENKEQRIVATSQISNINIKQISPNSVSITFNTYSPLTSTILYGKSSLTLNETIISPKLSQKHGLIIRGLSEGENYIYKIKLTDASGREFTSELMPFQSTN